MKKTTKILITMMILSTALVGCGKKDVNTKTEPKNVLTQKVQKSTISVFNNFAGQIKADEEVSIVPKIPGKIATIDVEEGQKIKKGQVLFTLDAKDAASQAEQAKAALEVARANLNRTQNSGNQQTLLQMKTAYEQAKVSYEQSEKDLSNSKQLFEIGAVSQGDLDLIQNRYDLSKQQLDSAKTNYELYQNNGGPEIINVSKAQYEQAQAAYNIALNQLSNMMIKSPINGIVSQKNINIGEMASSAMTAIVVSDTSKLVADIYIPERLINKVKLNQSIDVTINSLGDKKLSGEVTLINPVIDSKTKNYQVKIKILDSSNELKAGMFAKIKLANEYKENIIAVPNQTIVSENDMYYVLRVRNNKVDKTAVKLGISNDEITEITEGINDGDKVILEGQSFLENGEIVK